VELEGAVEEGRGPAKKGECGAGVGLRVAGCDTMTDGGVARSRETPCSHRSCVGESFAYLQLSVLISYIVRNYTLKLATPEFPKTNYRVSGVARCTRVAGVMCWVLCADVSDDDCATAQGDGDD
jgi:hypothetical protein